VPFRDLTTVMSPGPGTRNSFVMLDSEATATPEQVMGTCLGLELEAAALYKRFQDAAGDAELAELWETMSHAETHHARMIAELANRPGFAVPSLPLALLSTIVERTEAIRREADAGELTDDRMLAIAAALEFSEMDDLFTAICRAAGVSHDSGRAEHIEPLVRLVLARQSGDGVLRHLLAALIRLDRRAPA
jgi:rubrerythrin